MVTAFIIFAVILLVIFVVLGLIGAALGRIGFSSQAIVFLVIAVLVGSFVNIPLFTLESRARIVKNTYMSIFGMTYRVPATADGSKKTVVAFNVGGALIPSIVSLYLLWRFPEIAGVTVWGDSCGDRFPSNLATGRRSWDRLPAHSYLRSSLLSILFSF